MVPKDEHTAGGFPSYRPVAALGAHDFEVLRLILGGGSVISWPRLPFVSMTEVDQFLRLHQIDIDEERDLRHLELVHRQAIDYLTETCGYELEASIRMPSDLRDLFLWASEPDGARRQQACTVLKCMHIAHHIEAHALHGRTAVREIDLADCVDERVRRVWEMLQARDVPVLDFSGNVKSWSSVMTKLLVKREILATEVYDRFRYRIVTRSAEDLAPVLVYLTKVLFPFSYLLPGQSENRLLRLGDVIDSHPSQETIRAVLTPELGCEADLLGAQNTSSAAGFRALKFVVEVPVHINQLALSVTGRAGRPTGHSVLPLVEFQVVDAASDRDNQGGEAAHSEYKARQLAVVRARLRDQD